jgi:hypothetical protein
MKRRWRRRQRARADVAFYFFARAAQNPRLSSELLYEREREREKSAWHTKSREIDMDDSRHNAALSGRESVILLNYKTACAVRRQNNGNVRREYERQTV